MSAARRSRNLAAVLGCLASASPAADAFPAEGVLVLHGGSAEQRCVQSPSAKRVDGLPVAAQCCEGAQCRRKTSGSEDDCIAGAWGGGSFELTTWTEARNKCTALGLSLCDRNCQNAGCNYNCLLYTSPSPRDA